jgi:hypothetical protein
MFSGKRPLLTQQSARVAQTKTYFEHHKLLQALPHFTFTPLAQSITKACGHYLQYPQAL